jgi:hypothetical protein
MAVGMLLAGFFLGGIPFIAAHIELPTISIVRPIDWEAGEPIVASVLRVAGMWSSSQPTRTSAADRADLRPPQRHRWQMTQQCRRLLVGDAIADQGQGDQS